MDLRAPGYLVETSSTKAFMRARSWSLSRTASTRSPHGEPLLPGVVPQHGLGHVEHGPDHRDPAVLREELGGMALRPPSKNRFMRSVSAASSKWCPRASLLQPRDWQAPYSEPRRRRAQKEQWGSRAGASPRRPW